MSLDKLDIKMIFFGKLFFSFKSHYTSVEKKLEDVVNIKKKITVPITFLLSDLNPLSKPAVTTVVRLPVK